MSVAQLRPCLINIEMARVARSTGVGEGHCIETARVEISTGVGVGHGVGLHSVGVGDEDKSSMSKV